MVGLFFRELILLAPQHIGQVAHALQMERCSLPRTAYQAPPPSARVLVNISLPPARTCPEDSAKSFALTA